MNLFYTDRSKADMESAFIWYERQQKGLGLEFLNCLEASVQNIINYPEMFQIRYSVFRSTPIRRFPFTIFYSIENKDIIVHSVFDNRLDPDKKP